VTINPGWSVAAAMVTLMVITVAAHLVAGLRLARAVVVAGVRATLQLGVAALLIASVISHLALSCLLVVVMFTMAVLTTARRVEARPAAWAWTALAMACGIVPVLGVLFVSGAVPVKGIALIPIAGIIIGNTMTAHTLVGRRVFAALREEHGQYEACLSLGMSPSQGIAENIHRRTPEALLPGLDQVRTSGVVTLPGAFIGVMLGGGTPAQAATAQLLVLFGVMATQTVTAGVADRFIGARRLLPADLDRALID
jgi:putative ABC transport system permease protein